MRRNEDRLMHLTTTAAVLCCWYEELQRNKRSPDGRKVTRPSEVGSNWRELAVATHHEETNSTQSTQSSTAYTTGERVRMQVFKGDLLLWKKLAELVHIGTPTMLQLNDEHISEDHRIIRSTKEQSQYKTSGIGFDWGTSCFRKQLVHNQNRYHNVLTAFWRNERSNRDETRRRSTTTDEWNRSCEKYRYSLLEMFLALSVWFILSQRLCRTNTRSPCEHNNNKQSTIDDWYDVGGLYTNLVSSFVFSNLWEEMKRIENCVIVSLLHSISLFALKQSRSWEFLGCHRARRQSNA